MVFAGYSGFVHFLQLASHELATIWHICDEIPTLVTMNQKSFVIKSCCLKGTKGSVVRKLTLPKVIGNLFLTLTLMLLVAQLANTK